MQNKLVSKDNKHSALNLMFNCSTVVAILTLIAPLLHSYSWLHALESLDTIMLAEAQCAALKKSSHVKVAMPRVMASA